MRVKTELGPFWGENAVLSIFAHKNGEVADPSGGGNGYPRSLAEVYDQAAWQLNIQRHIIYTNRPNKSSMNSKKSEKGVFFGCFLGVLRLVFGDLPCCRVGGRN